MKASILVILIQVAAQAARAQSPASPPPSPAPAVDALASESRFATLDGAKVHYRMAGTGEPAVVFIHGWTCDKSFWRAQTAALAGRGCVIAIDLPGHGESDKPEVAYTLRYFASAVHAVLEDAQVGKAILVGHSMGTPVAVHHFRAFPARTQAIVAVDGALRSFMSDPKQIEDFANKIKGPDGAAERAKMIDGMFPPTVSAGLKAEVKEKMLEAPEHVAYSAMKEMLDPAQWSQDKIEVPMLVINARTKFWPPDYESFVKDLVPGVDYRTMEGVGHFLQLEDPEAFNGILLPFLEKQGVGK